MNAELRGLVEELLRHRVGELPLRGWLADNDASRAVLHKLAAALSVAQGQGWLPIESAPPRGGVYMVACCVRGLVGQAKWQPVKRKWTFPSAQMAFVPTHWDAMPAAPAQPDGVA